MASDGPSGVFIACIASLADRAAFDGSWRRVVGVSVLDRRALELPRNARIDQYAVEVRQLRPRSISPKRAWISKQCPSDSIGSKYVFRAIVMSAGLAKIRNWQCYKA